MNVLLKLIILMVAVYVASYIIPGVVIDSIASLFVVSIILGVVNAFLKTALIILTFPLTVVTLGIFLLILNGLLILLVDMIVPGFSVGTFFTAILFSLVVSLVSWFLSRLK